MTATEARATDFGAQFFRLWRGEYVVRSISLRRERRLFRGRPLISVVGDSGRRIPILEEVSSCGLQAVDCMVRQVSPVRVRLRQGKAAHLA